MAHPSVRIPDTPRTGQSPANLAINRVAATRALEEQQVHVLRGGRPPAGPTQRHLSVRIPQTCWKGTTQATALVLSTWRTGNFDGRIANSSNWARLLRGRTCRSIRSRGTSSNEQNPRIRPFAAAHYSSYSCHHFFSEDGAARPDLSVCIPEMPPLATRSPPRVLKSLLPRFPPMRLLSWWAVRFPSSSCPVRSAGHQPHVRRPGLTHGHHEIACAFCCG